MSSQPRVDGSDTTVSVKDWSSDATRPARDARVRHHPRSADASAEALERLAGIIKLNGPIPPNCFWDADDERCDDGAGD